MSHLYHWNQNLPKLITLTQTIRKNSEINPKFLVNFFHINLKAHNCSTFKWEQWEKSRKFSKSQFKKSHFSHTS